VRRLGAGERAEVFLGHADLAEVSRGTTAAIKVFNSGVEQGSIDHEVAVLTHTDSRHLLGLRDVATASDARQCLVLPRLGTSLARLLAERPTLAQGEVVTILAPIADAIAALHDSRCCHGGLRPGSVFFDAVGAPVVACFGRASTFRAPRADTEIRGASVSELMAEPRVAGDLHDLRTLAGTLLERAVPPVLSGRHTALLDWLDFIELSSEVATFARELSARLFELAPAMPIEFSPAPEAAPALMVQAGRASRRVSADASVNTTASTYPQNAENQASPSSLPARLTAAFLQHPAVVRVSRRVLPITKRVGGLFATVRTPFRVAAGAGLVAIIVALALVPASLGSVEDSQMRNRGSGAHQQPASVVSEPKATRTPAAAPTVDGGDQVADDPVVAAKVLLREREVCIRKRSVICLDSVDQQGSSARDDDSYLIRSLQEGGAAPVLSLTGAEFTVTQRLGDSALLTAEELSGKKAQSILIVKGQSGWRIRDFIAG
jgi:hypothetical protein